MRKTRWLIIFMLTAFFLNFPLDSVQPYRVNAQEAPTNADGRSGQRRKIFDYLKKNHPDVLEKIQYVRKREKEMRRLVRQHAAQKDEEKKSQIEQKLREMTEEILSRQFEITDTTLNTLVVQYEQLRQRHEKNKARFDEIVEKRLKRLLKRP